MTSQIIFWVSISFIAYTYIGYPLFIFLLARSKPEPTQPAHSDKPFLSIILAVFNEEHRVVQRIQNLLECDYPDDNYEIILISDGSTDQTVTLVSNEFGDRIKLIALEQNEGKASAVNAGVAAAKGEILVFADCRQRFSENVIGDLVDTFSDSSVGAVSGELVLSNSDEDASVDNVGLYWKYEKMIRLSESRVGSVVGVTGAIYALRKSLFEPLKKGVILDDLVTPLRVIKSGYSVKMVDGAYAFDQISGTFGEEMNRKIRTLTGNFEVMKLLPWVNNPFKNPVWFQWMSHKVFRLFIPYAMIGALVSSLVAGGPFYTTMAGLQIIAYSAATVGIVGERFGYQVFGIFATFLMLNVAAFISLYTFLFSDSESLWRKH